jgi:hypothetical protein
MEDALKLIDMLAALLPVNQREAYRAKARADFAEAAGITARETTEKAEQREDFIAKLEAAEKEATSRGNTRLYGALHRHRVERERLRLPEGGYTNEQDANAAARLANNFGNLQRRLKAAGMEPLPPDVRVRAAQRMSKAFFRRGAEAT